MKYLSVAEVAQKLGNHEKTVRRYIANGDLQAKKIGGQWRIAQSWFDQYLKQEDSSECPHRHENFCIFMDSDFFFSDDPVQTCSIIDIDQAQAERYELLAKSKVCDILQRGERFKLEVQPRAEGLRIVLWGSPAAVAEVLEGLQ